MAIFIKLDELMKEKGYTLSRLADEIGITVANLSNFKTGKISEIRLSTLERICEILGCQPGDLVEYRKLEKKKIIPLFLDYSGTSDLLLKGGAENVKKFFDSIIEMQRKSNCEVQITMVTGSAFESAKSKYKLLYELANNYELPDLFVGAVAEYCGFLISKDGYISLLPLDTRILDKQRDISAIAEKYGGAINPDVTSMYNVLFDEISRTDLAKFSEEIDELINDEEIETITYYDDYGKECDIKPKIHSKSEVVYMLVKKLRETAEFPFVIIGGDSQEEDLKMYTSNKERFEEMGLGTVFIAPANIGELTATDKNIIVGKWENADGITDCIKGLTSRMRVNEDGGIEIWKRYVLFSNMIARSSWI